MSKNEKHTIKIKHAKIKDLEKICLYFSQDYTAIQTANDLGISRQTINNYYKLLRQRLHDEFAFIEEEFCKEIAITDIFHIRYSNLYKEDIFYIEIKENILILDQNYNSTCKLTDFIHDSLKDSLSKHKKANYARVLCNQKEQSFLVSGYFKKENYFGNYVENRLKKFRGITKEKLNSYLKESQIRYNFSSEMIYQKLVLSFKNKT